MRNFFFIHVFCICKNWSQPCSLYNSINTRKKRCKWGGWHPTHLLLNVVSMFPVFPCIMVRGINEPKTTYKVLCVRLHSALICIINFVIKKIFNLKWIARWTMNKVWTKVCLIGFELKVIELCKYIIILNIALFLYFLITWKGQKISTYTIPLMSNCLYNNSYTINNYM